MEQLPQVGFMKSFVLFWKNYVNFKGRSRRSEYWYMALWHLILMVPAVCVLMILNMQKWHYLNFSISEILKINSF
ncbi:DUF805 domain-containing protein [Staphylococcus aureus]|uniref:DUF805 domain-containing protein n=1 Tax=Staphylococcus aureus TaxID=1280 RepID=UPI000628DA2D|nr:hypothetical protein BN1323_160166 [Staphylococcus aureus]CRI21313.1 hypothetical protein BN1322_370163 [Staphylococcus aureus]CRI21558.1 hypothetical protein SAET23_360166 [Staphylococcus aureus]CRI27237.1 hypothetical protein BN1325_360085 [Staphylococcus aureus]CRI27967.1 hypothetical protein SAET23_360166 [Staphylococcus aureus]